MTDLRFARLGDRRTATGAGPLETIDLSGFAGGWTNTDRANPDISRFTLELHGDELSIRAWRRSPAGEVDSGLVPLDDSFSDGLVSSEGAGFIVDLDFGTVHAHVQANLKIGVAVLGIFYEDDATSGASRYFNREFFARDQDAGRPSVAATRPGLHSPLHAAAGPGPGLAGLECVLGQWRNTNRSSHGVIHLSVESHSEGDSEGDSEAGSRGDSQGTHVRAQAAHQDSLLDWGRRPATAYPCIEEDSVRSACVLAHYAFDFMRVALQIRQNKGILAVTYFTRFEDASRRYDYVTRELYHRQAAGERVSGR